MPSRTFPSSKSWLSASAIWGTTALLLVLLGREAFSDMPLAGKIGIGLFCGAVAGLLLWTWFSTYYRISGDTLHYRCGPLHGDIPIRQIRKIAQNQYLWSGLRPGLGLHGIILYYNRWDEIYLSPTDQERFLAALQEVNPGIVVEKGS